MTVSYFNFKFNVILKCLRGIEHNLFNELQSFGIERNSLIRSKCKIKVLDCDLKHVYFLSHFSRLASNVYIEVGRIQLSDKKNVFKSCESIQWNSFLSPSNSYLVNCGSLESNKYINSKLYACQLAKDGIKNYFISNLNLEAPRVELKNPEVKLELDIDENCTATVMVDATGSPLSSRGYRYKPNIADIDPTMACSILYDLGYTSFSDTAYSIEEYEDHCKEKASADYNDDEDNPGDKLGLNTAADSIESQQIEDFKRPRIVDLFSGCGVFLIESALWAARIPPGYLKTKFALKKMPIHDDIAYKSLITYTNGKKARQGSKEWSQLSGSFIGIERDWEKVEASLKSSEKAGVLELMSFNQADYLKDGIKDARAASGGREWEYMIAQLPQMKEPSCNHSSNGDDSEAIKAVDSLGDGGDSNGKDEGPKTKLEKEYGKDKSGKKNKLSANRYLKLVKSLARVKKKYFQEGAKGALMMPSFIDKVYVEDSFSAKLSAGKTYSKNGINTITYYTGLVGRDHGALDAGARPPGPDDPANVRVGVIDSANNVSIDAVERIGHEDVVVLNGDFVQRSFLLVSIVVEES
ncbi:methylase [Theileria orientalis strain Shintoku]|uniref:Methylase n=1 Tax=Theileria orientalis strain Shintoku TaxID=869250 RepID=J4DQ30_THEOR|nr:LOW QUALITY PROTEIN: methylase [Theileria orientalis strain Shintoku]BAM41739.1 methylase [Theileria orientalis strain Shintoku]|eukprot:XP_009692040.1 LOW QUALITY PROTEIN: methylase [Theileria orientalis strain Shintoku]